MGRSTALLIGNSDGIGLAVTHKLLEQDWDVVGISRSPVDIRHPAYTHHVQDIAEVAAYVELIQAELRRIGSLELCIFFAGMGENIDLGDLSVARRIFEVNLMAVVHTCEQVVPDMIRRGRGHFIGLSSVADAIIDKRAVSYCASKAGMTGFLNGLGLAMRGTGVAMTNIRFGFVDTKMAKAPVRPFMIETDKAAGLVLRCIRTRPLQFTYPKLTGWLSWLVRAVVSVQVWFTRFPEMRNSPGEDSRK